MITYENNCVGCPDGIPCIGKICPLVHQEVVICDQCGNHINSKYYKFTNKEYCEDCIDDVLNEEFHHLTLSEKVEIFDVGISSID